MQIIFCASRKIGSMAIRAVTWSKWSHVAIVDGDEVIEAKWPGVVVRPLAELQVDNQYYTVVDLPCRSPEAAIAAARSQVGKMYDMTALFGLFMHRDWQEEDRWFCSELVAWAFDQAGSPLFRPEAMHRITPEHLWMLSPERHKDLVFFSTLEESQ